MTYLKGRLHQEPVFLHNAHHFPNDPITSTGNNENFIIRFSD